MSIKNRLNKLLAKMPKPAPPIEFITYIIGKDPEPESKPNRWIEGKSYEHIYRVANEEQKRILQEL